MRPTKAEIVGELGETYEVMTVGDLGEADKGSGSWRTRRDLHRQW